MFLSSFNSLLLACALYSYTETYYITPPTLSGTQGICTEHTARSQV